MGAEEWKEQRDRLRYEVVERPNDRVLQWHRNEWPALWAVIDEMVADTDEDTWIGNPEDMPEDPNGWGEAKMAEGMPIPEVPMAATFDEDDELVAMEALPDIPEPGESSLKDFDAPPGLPEPPDEEFDLPRDPGYEE